MVADGADSISAKERLNRVRGGAVEVEGRVDGPLGGSGRAGRRRGDELCPARRVAALCYARHGSPRTGKRNGVAKSNLASESAAKGLSGGGACQRSDAWLLRHCMPPFKQNTKQTDLKCPPPVRLVSAQLQNFEFNSRLPKSQNFQLELEIRLK